MMNQSALLRPDWTPATVALMVLGFMVFWPLGLAMLAYILFGEKFQSFKREANQKADSAFAWCRSNRYAGPVSATGNVAFDDWRKAELDRLDIDPLEWGGRRVEGVRMIAAGRGPPPCGCTATAPYAFHANMAARQPLSSAHG